VETIYDRVERIQERKRSRELPSGAWQTGFIELREAKTMRIMMIIVLLCLIEIGGMALGLAILERCM
jgi:hypothetical protein